MQNLGRKRIAYTYLLSKAFNVTQDRSPFALNRGIPRKGTCMKHLFGSIEYLRINNLKFTIPKSMHHNANLLEYWNFVYQVSIGDFHHKAIVSVSQNNMTDSNPKIVYFLKWLTK